MSNSSWKKMDDVKVGDAVVGIHLVTVNKKKHRKFIPTIVKNKWQRETEAVEFIADTSVQIFPTVCSSDHRWMSADHHRWIKASIINLNTKIEALQTIFFEVKESEDYKKGYLAGIIHGDATMGIYQDKRENRQKTKIYSFRLAMNDKEAIDRAEDYLKHFDIIPSCFLFKSRDSLMPAIRTASSGNWHKIESLIAYKRTKEYLHGYLGGIYDAEGSLGKDRHKAIRIPNTNQEIIRIVEEAFHIFEFNYTKEFDKTESGKTEETIRLLGGRGATLRFLNLINPAIIRKTEILTGQNIKGRASILAIKRVGKKVLYDIETGTGNFIANSLISHNCYARRIYDRFHYDPTIRLDEKELQAPFKLKEPSRIFVGSTIELFGDWVVDSWIEKILKVVYKNPQHTFQFLTKNPQRLEEFHFPINCWLGVTVTTQEDKWKADYLAEIDFDRYQDYYPRKHITFISYEPLQGDAGGWLCGIKWVIIGAETGSRKGKTQPKYVWIKNILYHAKYWNVPVFMKDNLPKFQGIEKRQEFPYEQVGVKND